MARFKVRGESTVQWAMVVNCTDETDYIQAGEIAKEFMDDMLQVEPFGYVTEVEITGQQDRTLKIIEVEDGDKKEA